ncbi:MAG: alcohol dehydrogenase catalytic domain-containing protein [Actinomycetota bacterium]
MELPTTHAKQREPAQPRPQKDETMRALVWKGVGKVAVEDEARPAIGAPHEAIVKITSTTICGSDLHLYHASIPATSGITSAALASRTDCSSTSGGVC